MRYEHFENEIIDHEHATRRWLIAFAIGIPLALIGFLIALYSVYR